MHQLRAGAMRVSGQSGPGLLTGKELYEDELLGSDDGVEVVLVQVEDVAREDCGRGEECAGEEGRGTHDLITSEQKRQQQGQY